MAEDSKLGDVLGAKKEKRTRGAKTQSGLQRAVRCRPGWTGYRPHAERLDDEQQPRRAQMNVDVPEDLRKEFRRACRDDGRQVRFVVEDLV
jgi:hypothetical protein